MNQNIEELNKYFKLNDTKSYSREDEILQDWMTFVDLCLLAACSSKCQEDHYVKK